MEEKVTGSVYHEQRVKLAKEQKESKKKKKVIEQWIELRSEKGHRKGGEVVLCQRTSTGVFRQYVGREKEAGDVLSKAKKDGTLRVV